MDAIRIRGNRKLTGTLRVGGAKNAALPILCATLLSDGRSRLRNVPGLRDIETAAALLTHLGRTTLVNIPEVVVEPNGVGHVPEAPYDLVRQMRASIPCSDLWWHVMERHACHCPAVAPLAQDQSTSI